MAMRFDYGATPQVLQGLSAGQLASRWQRTVRLWWLLRSLYGGHKPWCEILPEPFRFEDVRSRIYTLGHQPTQNSQKPRLTICQQQNCLCQRSLHALLMAATPRLDLAHWQTEMAHLTGIPPTDWAQHLTQAPFAVVERSLRDDLKALATQGWLATVGRGQWQTVPPETWPPLISSPTDTLPDLTATDTWTLLRVLEDIAFVQPQLDVVIDRLWQQVATQSISVQRGQTAPQKRIFLHLDYIVSDAMQEQVDTHQQVIEHLWQQPDGGVIQFATWIARQEQQVTVTVYPVCLHYARRAKYLSAYGCDPAGQLGWHNYRLDRIASPQLKVLAWGDPAVPQALKHQRDRGELPTPNHVEEQLQEAWGFNFYLPKAWLLMRFSPWFARWYVDATDRHPTFGRVEYAAVRSLIQRQVPPAEQALVARVWQQRSPQDVYYAGWVRLGDINVIMRLRDWRPQGEVIAPWPLRLQMMAEVQQEARHYGEPAREDV